MAPRAKSTAGRRSAKTNPRKRHDEAKWAAYDAAGEFCAACEARGVSPRRLAKLAEKASRALGVLWTETAERPQVRP